MVVLLTKIDLACPQTRENLLHVFHSQRIQNSVRMISKKFQGLPTNKIFPIKNYEWESELNPQVNSLSLLALRQMLRFAQDHIEEKADEIYNMGTLWSRASSHACMVPIFTVFLTGLLLFVYFTFEKFKFLSGKASSYSQEAEFE